MAKRRQRRINGQAVNHVNPELLKQRGFVETKPGVWEKPVAGASDTPAKTRKGKQAQAFLAGFAKENGFVETAPEFYENRQKGKSPVVVEAGRAGPSRARRPQTGKLECGDADEGQGETCGGEAGAARFVVRVVSYRGRLLDDDNVCEKHVVDGLRYAGLLPDDTHKQARILTWQVQCKKGEERTEVTLVRRK